MSGRHPGRPYGLCERDANGSCIGKCGRRGHLGRPLTAAEWLHFFGPEHTCSPGCAAVIREQSTERIS